MNLPQDPAMLMSFINMKLRDEYYDSLKDLCNNLDLNEKELTKTLKEAGFDYYPDTKQFR